MAEIDVTRMSSKGQVVIPRQLRGSFKEGEQLIVIRSEGKIILQSAKNFDAKLKDDIIFAKRTEEALKRYDKGEFKSFSSKEEFLAELEKW
ncbi:MAG TPA: AbrB/MazE/SpoVT family DNA-binding domain-containing protein [Candidatus Nanoarchaeia archaeon]|nr:AbrB/MazE/SpoVT family DNA-binding domain-containing protein [Candidatus Nanoarchaeia archaeon]